MSAQKKRSSERWIKPFFKQYRGALVLALFLGVATYVFASALMFDAGYLISKAAEAPGNIVVIFIPVAFARIFGVGKPILQYLERLTSHNWILRMTSSLRLKLYNVLEKDAIFIRQRLKTGDILGLLSEDIGHIQNLYLRTIFPFIVSWALYIIIIICLGFFSPWFALVMLFLLGVVVLVVPLVSALIQGARQTRRKVMKNDLYEHLTDNVLGVSDWIIAGRSSEYVSTYKTSEDAFRAVNAKLLRGARNRGLLLQILYAAIVVALLLWAGSYFGGMYAGSANWIAAFVLAFFPLIDAFAPLPAAAIETSTYRDSISRLNELPDEDESDVAGGSKEAGARGSARTDGGGSANEASGCASKDRHSSPETPPATPLATDHATPLATPPATDHATANANHEPLAIRINQLSFRYPHTSRDVLVDLNLTIAPGEKLAVLGRSGTGKSTLAALIRGDLTPTKGAVLLDGVATSELGDEITHYIGVIQQHTYLFNATLAENLRIGNQHATDEELWKALDTVGLSEMAERLPKGLETLVDEAGLRFSGGERHRIALARVLLCDVPIVILDEPTVGLDPLTEQALLTTIFETLSNKTVIMITHHLQGITLMDNVIFIEEGKLKLKGSPDELAASSLYYQKLQTFDKGIAL